MRATTRPKAKPVELAPASRKGGPPRTPAPELVDLNGAVRLLKTSRPTFYRWLRAGRIKGMKVGRQWRFYREDINRFLRGHEPRIDVTADLSPLLDALRSRLRQTGGADPSDPEAPELEQVCALIVALGAALRASDIHLTAHISGPGEAPAAVIRHRIDGVLHETARFDVRLLAPLVEQWKRLAACDVLEQKASQDGRAPFQLYEGTDRERRLDLRICFVPAVLGETATIRILDPAAVNLDLARIDYDPADRERILRALEAPDGIILVTGPTGCGKTTALYCCLNQVAGPSLKTMTVEDPVEYLLPWTTQVGLNPAAGVTFPRVIRSFLRSAPDIIMVGEVRDRETLMLVIPAALTGHLVLTTLHAPDSAAAIVRMMEIGADPFLVADSARLVLSQRLIRLLCRDCAVPAQLAADQLTRARQIARDGGLDPDSLPAEFRRPVGCDKCAKTGYRGRTVIAETLELTGEIRQLLRKPPTADELRAAAVREGMTTMAADGFRRAARGLTTLDEVDRVLR